MAGGEEQGESATRRYHAHMNAPMRRVKMRHIAVGVLLLATMVIGWFAVRLIALKPGQPGRFNPKVMEVVESAQSELAGPNGWDDYLAVVSLYENTTKRLKSETSPKPPEGWTGQAWPVDVAELSPPTGADVRSAIEKFVAAHRESGLFDAMARLSAARRYVRPIPAGQALLAQSASDAGIARDITKLAVASMRLAAEARDEKVALASFDQAMTLSEILGRQSTRFEQLQSIAISGAVHEEARRLAGAAAISPAGLRAMLARIDAARPLSLVVFFEADWYTLLDTLEWTHSDDGNGDGTLLIGDSNASSAGPVGARASGIVTRLAGLTKPSKAQSVRMAKPIYDAAIAAARLPPAPRDAKLRALDTEVEAIPSQYTVLRETVPAFGASSPSLMSADAEREGTKLALAISIFKIEKKRLPRNLAELSPDIVPAMPGWSYRVTAAGETPDGREYLLYHAGLDGVDNGGKANPFGAHASWNAQYSNGHDYIVDQWNEEHQ